MLPVRRCVERFGGNRHLMWSNFKELRQELEKRKATCVGGVMRDAITVDEDLPLSRAADLIVNKKANRLVRSVPDLLRISCLSGWVGCMSTEKLSCLCGCPPLPLSAVCSLGGPPLP